MQRHSSAQRVMKIPRFDWKIILCGLAILLVMLLIDTQARPLPRTNNAIAGNIRQGRLKGKVVKIEAESSRVTLRHEPVPELEMDAMTMPFRVKNAEVLSALQAGDSITAVVCEEQDTGRIWLENLKKYSSSASANQRGARNKKAARR